MSPIRIAAPLAAACLMAGCAAPEDGAFVSDPYEETNRSFHSFNKGLDSAIVRPAAVAYETVTPLLFQHLISNGLDTLALPNDFVNNVLQGDVDGALQTAGRLTVNVLMGAGVLDPATPMGLPRKPTDFGMTLASYGADEGVYLELPVFGPSNTRDAVGRLVNAFLDPVSYAVAGAAISDYFFIESIASVVDARKNNMNAIDQVLYESEDSYISTRSAYVQLRRRAVEGEATPESLPDVFGE